MADYKVVDAEQLDADLTIVADAIREKGGTTEQLSFPQGMKQAVEAIQSGGGSGEEFVGIKFGDTFNYRGQPTMADASKMPEENSLFGGYTHMFYNNTSNGNGGLYVALETVYMPKLIMFGVSLFENCANLKNIYGDFTGVTAIQTRAFGKCLSLSTLPYMENVEIIGNAAFYNCTSLTDFPYLPKLKTIGIDVIENTAITEVKIYSNNITSFNQYAFRGSSVTDIYVPWAEGEVANAPWGATSATVHYNTTYDENHNPIV